MSGSRRGLSRTAAVAAATAAAFALATPFAEPRAAPADSATRLPAAVPGELIVRYEPGSNRAERAVARRQSGVRAVRGLRVAGTQLVEVRRASTARTLAALRRDQDVRSVSRNWIRRPAAVPEDPLFDELWGLHNTGQPVGPGDETRSGAPDADIDAPEAWDIEPGWGVAPDGTEPVVAVMDTGADLGHVELEGRLWTNEAEAEAPSNEDDDDGNGYDDDVHGYDFAGESFEEEGDADPDPSDPAGHGTHVAGTVLAEADNGEGIAGVAPRAELMVLKVCAFDEEGRLGCPSDAMIEAFGYARENGADVLNGSVSGPEFSEPEWEALNSSPGVLFVFAAGNGGRDEEGDNNDKAPAYPCGYDEHPEYTAENLLCVAATDQDDVLAPFSNFGLQSVDLGAPGTRTLSAWPEEQLVPFGFLPYVYLPGTSMATAHVAGTAALMLTALPETTPSQAKEAIRSSADSKRSLEGKTVSGGRLNTRSALEALGLTPRGEGGEEEASDEGATGSEAEEDGGGARPQSLPVDRTAPETAFRVRPRRILLTLFRRRTVAFRLGSDEQDVRFVCRLDRRPLRFCGPGIFWRLPVGRHVLRVSARDAAGNIDRTPAVHRFRVVRVSRAVLRRIARRRAAKRRAASSSSPSGERIATR